MAPEQNETKLVPVQPGKIFLVLAYNSQGLYRSWETWKVLEFYNGIFQDWKVLEKGHWSWKLLEICSTQLKYMKCMQGSERINIEILGV